LAPNIENLVLNFWIYINGTVGTSLAPLAGRWHVFIFPDEVSVTVLALAHAAPFPIRLG